MVKLNKTDEQVIAALKEGKELTLQEIADKTGEKPKKVFKSLRKLFENELIETNARKYKLTGKKPSGKNEEETDALPE
jgi:predicted transcriptional regulator